jgi:hypothetical protein
MTQRLLYFILATMYIRRVFLCTTMRNEIFGFTLSLLHCYLFAVINCDVEYQKLNIIT